MGKGGKGKGKGKGGKGRRRDHDEQKKWLSDKRAGQSEAENAADSAAQPAHKAQAQDAESAFRSYYEAQCFFGEGEDAGSEFERFWSVMHTALPVTVRVDQHRNEASGIEQQLQAKGWKRRAEFDRSGMSVWQISNDEYTASPQGQAWTERENRRGTLAFQELVSLIPALVLAPQRQHRCVDLCAAPGGKSLQLLEAMGSGEDPDDGVLLSTDNDPQRCCLVLWRMLAKASSPSSCSALANAKEFPLLLEVPSDNPGSPVRLEYDRILADVPCSGDGTVRKNSQVWRAWGPREALSLHSLQKQILLRALYLLAPGGIVAYSTCSLNPVENEAVVLAAIRRWKNTEEGVELLDAHAAVDVASGLKTSPGLTTWVVSAPSRGGGIFRSWDEVPEELRDPTFSASGGEGGSKRAVLLRPDFFPCGAESDQAEDSLRASLRKCARFFPQHGDTGGFFVALLRKGSSKTQRPNPRPVTAEGNPPSQPSARHPLLHSTYSRVKATDAAWLEIKEFFKLDEKWCQEKLERGLLLWQWMHKDQPERLTLVSDGVARLWGASSANGKPISWTRMGTFLFEGLPKGFLKGLVPTRWRIAGEGAQRVGPLVSSRKVLIEPSDALLILRSPHRQAMRTALNVRLPDEQGLIAEDKRHICGGILLRICGVDGNFFWVPGALTPQMLRILIDDDDADALADWLEEGLPKSVQDGQASGSRPPTTVAQSFRWW
eukprot:CAMPEP_0178419328 /NCGR_PEP_ID=MMETSP0689_2-20121128/25552_1 /TAXON_ID=160604 /ORGANISM="Amphidinium massartii, Strain CS-259" /LENGTH=717 /DNA_ID=CAMNT_0020040759 /DNA_START=37 /DNA_END=2187 /DNA_ORIENTATION=+